MNKIGIVVENITNRAGIERAVTNLCNSLCDFEEYNIVLISICSKDGCVPAYKLDNRVDLLHLNVKKKKKYGWYIEFYNLIKKIINYEKLDYIIGTTYALNSVISVLDLRVKKIGCEHFNYNSATFLGKVVRRLFYNNLSAIVLLTKSDARNYSFLDAKKIYIIPNSLSFKCNGKYNCDSKQIIAVGRLEMQKGFDILIEIAKKTQKLIPDWKFVIYGEGSEKDNLLRKIKNNELGGYVEIKPSVIDVEKILLNSSIYVMTSRFEGLPMVLIEAKECGLPEISFDCKEGPSEIIEDGVDGYIIPVNDNEMFIEKLVMLAKDKEKRVNFSEHSKINAKRFSSTNVSNLWKEMLEQV